MGSPYREPSDPEPAKPHHPYVRFLAQLMLWLPKRAHRVDDPELIKLLWETINAAVEERHDLYRRIAHLERRLQIAEHTCGSAHVP